MAIWILAREAHAISWQDIAAEFKSLSPAVLLSSGLLALVSYGVLTLYDFLALGYVGASLRYLRVAPVSFSAFAKSFSRRPLSASRSTKPSMGNSTCSSPLTPAKHR